VRELGPRTRAELTGVIDQATHFLILADLLGDPANQFLIQMLEQNCSIPRGRGFMLSQELFEYSAGDTGAGWGGFDINKLCSQLPDADLICQDLRSNISLTERGKDYASWLIKNGRKSDYFWSKRGQWGERPTWFHPTGVKGELVTQPAAPVDSLNTTRPP